MSRYRLTPAPAQEIILAVHCSHARYVWNLAAELFTSQQCSTCGHVAADSRKSQALFRCMDYGYVSNADVNAARNIAAGHAVSARGRSPLGERENREPQPLSLSA